MVNVCIDKRGEGAQRYLLVLQFAPPEPEFLNFLGPPGIDSTELIPYNLSPLSVVMEHVTSQQCPLNVIYTEFFEGSAHYLPYGSGKYLL